MRELFNKETLLMVSIIIVFGVLAGGSLVDAILSTIIFIIVLFAAISLFLYIYGYVNKNKTKKRLSILKSYEDKLQGFENLDKIGDSRCTIYFDIEKETALIVSITTNGITEYFVDDFSKSVEVNSSGNFCIVDHNKRKALLIYNNVRYGEYRVVDYSLEEDNSNAFDNKLTTPRLFCASCYGSPIFILVEEGSGYIYVFDNFETKPIHYIQNDKLVSKIGQDSVVSGRSIGQYFFVVDDFFKILVIIYLDSNYMAHRIINFSDIISVNYEENGSVLFSKSTSRSIGGAIAGGVLMGGAGAIVGGLSGNTSQIKQVYSMTINILVKNIENPKIVLKIHRDSESFNTKDQKVAYQNRLEEANDIKDLISVIIDKANQQQDDVNQKIIHSPNEKFGFADELLKLAQLKESGILTDEEFRQQKNKLLNENDSK